MREEKNVTGRTLKMIAIVTMLIDHVAASVLIRWFYYMEYHQWKGLPFDAETVRTTTALIYELMRGIGRLAFPIFIYMLIEGYGYTRNKKKYALRLFLFTFISQIPFSYALFSTINPSAGINVYFTLFLGLMAIWASDSFMKRFGNTMMTRLPVMLIMLAFIALGENLRSDYGGAGVLAILMGWIAKDLSIHLPVERKPWMNAFQWLERVNVPMVVIVAVLSIFSSSIEILALLDLIPLAMYKGEKGKQNKYFFYIFYPAHLAVLALICYVSGI